MLKIVLKIFTLLFLFSFPIFSNSIEKADWEIEEIYIFQQKLNVSTPKITKNSIKTDSIEDKYILNSILERESNSKFLFSNIDSSFFRVQTEKSIPKNSDEKERSYKFKDIITFSSTIIKYLILEENSIYSKLSHQRNHLILNLQTIEFNQKIKEYQELLLNSPPYISPGVNKC